MSAQQKNSYVQNINPQTFDSEPYGIYNEHNYDYYNAIFKKATKLRNVGIILTSAGVGLFVGALIASNYNLNTTGILLLSSVATISVGAPLWIAGGVKRKNNRKAMEQIKRNMSVSFRTTNSGVGLVLNF